jgi:hypothetical protein
MPGRNLSVAGKLAKSDGATSRQHVAMTITYNLAIVSDLA